MNPIMMSGGKPVKWPYPIKYEKETKVEADVIVPVVHGDPHLQVLLVSVRSPARRDERSGFTLGSRPGSVKRGQPAFASNRPSRSRRE